MDLFCGAGLLAVSCAKRMLDAKTPLKHVYGYEVYNQAVANARTNAVAVGMNKKNFLFKSADLSQPTLGVPIKGDVVICGRLPPITFGTPPPSYLPSQKARWNALRAELHPVQLQFLNWRDYQGHRSMPPPSPLPPP